MTAPLLSLPPSPQTPLSPKTPPVSARWPWLREPLLHFIALGGILFGLDRLLITRADDPHLIVVSAEVDREAIETFKAARGHDPNAEELTALRQVWLDNEVLYREGLAMQVDKGDPAIRERVIFKALSVVDSNVKIPAISEADLQKWFEAHRDKYDEPGRFDFEEAALSGEGTEAAVRAFVAALEAGMPGDTKAGLRMFKGRPLSNLVQSYGADFAQALAASKPGVWQAMKTKDGWRAIKLDAIKAAQPASFARMRNVVLQDWKDDVGSQQRTDAVRALAKKYTIKHEVATGKADLE
ncbi:MAG TPA: peptidylprolyl isomerase [Polyangia bacterium]|nr:peptidylprolyl isomerase [Polyangia bacterium]